MRLETEQTRVIALLWSLRVTDNQKFADLIGVPVEIINRLEILLRAEAPDIMITEWKPEEKETINLDLLR